MEVKTSCLKIDRSVELMVNKNKNLREQKMIYILTSTK